MRCYSVAGGMLLSTALLLCQDPAPTNVVPNSAINKALERAFSGARKDWPNATDKKPSQIVLNAPPESKVCAIPLLMAPGKVTNDRMPRHIIRDNDSKMVHPPPIPTCSPRTPPKP